MNELEERKEKHYTVKEAANRTGINYSVISKACRTKRLKCSELPSAHGNAYMIAESDLQYWLDNVYKAHGSTVSSVQSMTVEDLAAEIDRRIKSAYDQGYKEGRKAARTEFMSAFKDIK